MILRPLIRMHRDALMGVSANHPTGIERPVDHAREPKHIVEFSRLADQYPVNGADKSRVKNDPLGLPIFSHARHDEAGTLAGKVPPPKMLPLVSAPVEKLTEPNECPRGALIPLKPTSSAPADTMPALVMLTVPKLLPKSIASAHAATGNSSVQRPSTTAIFLMASSTEPGRPVLTLTLATTGVEGPGRVDAHTLIPCARESCEFCHCIG